MSAIVGKRSRESDINELLSLNRPRGQEPLLNKDQLSVVNKVMGYSSIRVTATVTFIGSTLALVVVIAKSSRGVWWWILLAALCVAFGIWTWIYTSKPGTFADKKLLNISRGNWALLSFCMFDAVLAVLSVLALF
jgi:hypothetical protein